MAPRLLLPLVLSALVLCSCGSTRAPDSFRAAALAEFEDRVGVVGRQVKLTRTLEVYGGTLDGRNPDGTITEYVAPAGGTDREGQPGIELHRGADVRRIVLRNGDGIRKVDDRGVSEVVDVAFTGTYEGAVKANTSTGKLEIQGCTFAGEDTVHDVLSLGGNEIHVGTDRPNVFVSDSNAALTTQRTTHSRTDPRKNVKRVKRPPTTFVLGENEFRIRRDKLQQKGDRVIQR